MTIDEAVVRSGFKNPLDAGSRKFAQKSLGSNEELLFAYNGNYTVVPSSTPLRPGKVFSIKNKRSGVLAITDKRVYLCHSLFGDSINKEIPLMQIQSIDEAGSVVLGTAQLRIKGLTEFFIIDLNHKQKSFIPEVKSIIASATAKLQSPQVSVSAITSSAAEQLLKLKALLDAGLLTKEEFDKEKAKLLG